MRYLAMLFDVANELVPFTEILSRHPGNHLKVYKHLGLGSLVYLAPAV
jgi:hypothetical protein